MQIFLIVCNDTSHPGQVFQLMNMQFVYLKERQTPPSSDQLWYRKDGPDRSFTIISMSNGKALKCDPKSSQVVFCGVSEEGDHWEMDHEKIVHKPTSKPLFFDKKGALYCDGSGFEGFMEERNSFTFQKMV